jgi:hypothetical protein
VTQPIKTAFGALIYLGMPLFFIALPQTFFETGGNSICLIKFVFGIECYGCGMTRAFQHAIHLDFIGALGFNKLICIVFPLMIYIGLTGVLKLIHDARLIVLFK